MHTHEHDHPSHPEAEASWRQEPADTANQSLADALRVSFRILKLILIVIVILYLGSGINTLEQNQKAIVLRLGKLIPDVKGPGGLVFAFPRPIDEVIKVPVTEKRTLIVRSHDIFLKEGEKRSDVSRSGGLKPDMDGSLLTGEKWMIHAEWVVTYEIYDLKKFIGNIYMPGQEFTRDSENAFINKAIENAGVQVAGQMKAADAVLNQIDSLRLNVKNRAQAILEQMDTGITIVSIDALPNWPKQTVKAFEELTQAENEKSKQIERANQFETELLNATAGAASLRIKDLLNEYWQARSDGDSEAADTLIQNIEQIIQTVATGYAGQTIQMAQSHKKQVLENIRADVVEYQKHLEEYKRSPMLLIARLWNEVQLELFTHNEVSKRYYPAGQKEIRLQLGIDPQEKDVRETRRYEKQDKEKGDFAEIKPSEDQSGIVRPKPVLR